jgi:hypothetical protein
VSFPTYYDKNNEAYDALVKFSEPAYWVVDASGRIVFSNVRLPDVRLFRKPSELPGGLRIEDDVQAVRLPHPAAYSGSRPSR